MSWASLGRLVCSFALSPARCRPYPQSWAARVGLERANNRLSMIKTMQTRMAFWLAPGQTAPACPAINAINTERLSGHDLIKTVEIGARGLPNVIEHRVTFRVPTDYDTAVFEALTAYLPIGFSIWTYDPAQDRLAPLSDGPGEQRLPVIIATPDGRYALGVYSPDLPQQVQKRARYGRFRFPDAWNGDNAAVKWNCVFRRRIVKATDYRFTCYCIVGTLDDVREAMSSLTKGRRDP
jgi:hypothetical protein